MQRASEQYLATLDLTESQSESVEHTILIIDDDSNLILSIKEALYSFTEFNFTIESANNPIVGLELIKVLYDEGVRPSLILCDLSMPGMQGDEVLEASMEYFPDAKKMLMSGHPNLDAVLHSVNSAHIFRMLTKPIQELEFKMAIKQAIEAIELEMKVKEANLKLQKINENLARIVEEKVYELAYKNQQLTDSINYAGLIQKSVLSCENDFNNELPGAFTLILPKDIVSGDFFWYHNEEDHLSYCMADSTGHGVPGAFVSLLAFGALRESFELTKHKEDVNAIICAANNQFKKTLKSNPNKDSAELGYFFLNWKTLELKYCGFKTSLFIVRKHELIELPGSKLIFGDEKLAQIDNELIQTFSLQHGDSIFMTSDGFIDQFGGKNNKKFGSKRFKMLITLVANHHFANHRHILHKEFIDWKGNTEQTDDVSVFGLTV